MSKLLFFTFFVFQVASVAAQNYPAEVTSALYKTKSNRTELEKVITYFKKSNDPLKLKAAYFLIANMDIHLSESYYWADSLGNKVPFNEIEYPDFAASIAAFDSIKMKVSKIHPVKYSYRDIDTLNAEFLIDNINNAFKSWEQSFTKHISFSDFCEYVLPYRVSVEPIHKWRNEYSGRFNYLQKYDNIDTTLLSLKRDITDWFVCTYNLEKRPDPLPRLGALHLLLRKKGTCEDVAGLGVFALRSQGIASSIDYVPVWATSSGNHTLNAVISEKNKTGKAIHYDLLLLGDSTGDFVREPAKVIRYTYSKQKNTLPYEESVTNIPPGFLQSVNYKDVTDEYWDTQDVVCKLENSAKYKQKIAYATVFNSGKWVPCWWGNATNNTVSFSKMCKGALFVPMVYFKDKLIPVGNPVAVGYNGFKEIILDTVNRKSVTLPEQEHYLRYRSGKNTGSTIGIIKNGNLFRKKLPEKKMSR